MKYEKPGRRGKPRYPGLMASQLDVAHDKELRRTGDMNEATKPKE